MWKKLIRSVGDKGISRLCCKKNYREPNALNL